MAETKAAAGVSGGRVAAAAAAAALAPSQETTFLVTGCSAGGIGYALARELASRPGVFVIATARNVDAMRGLLEEQEPSGAARPAAANANAGARGRVALVPLDVAHAASVAACRDAVDALTGGRGVDALVNNAGATVQGALLDVPVDAARRVFAVNVLGGLAAAQAFAPAMVARGEGGLVCNVGSAAGYASLPLKAVYSATKHAVRVMSDALRVELSPFGVRVMLVAPGYVRTAIDVRSREQGGWFGPAHGASAYALYDKAAGIVSSSIFDEGSLGGGRALAVGVFARRLADAMVKELGAARRCARRGTRAVAAVSAVSAAASRSSSPPSPRVVRVGKAARAWASRLVPFSGRRGARAAAAAAEDGDDEEQRAPLELAGRPTTAGARAPGRPALGPRPAAGAARVAARGDGRADAPPAPGPLLDVGVAVGIAAAAVGVRSDLWAQDGPLGRRRRRRQGRGRRGFPR